MAPYSSPSTSPFSTLRSKAPILNPYDKFTQPEFDAWIGGITSALRHALDPEDESLQPPPPTPSHPIRSRISPPRLESGEEYAEEDADDSFAEVIQRRRVAKGKQRDPAEGPGLYHDRGAREAPIEIFDEEEEEEESETGAEAGGEFSDQEAWEEHEVNASIMAVDGDDSDHDEGDPREPPWSSHAAKVPTTSALHSYMKSGWDVDDDRGSASSTSSEDESPEPEAVHVSEGPASERSSPNYVDSGSDEESTNIPAPEAEEYPMPTSSGVPVSIAYDAYEEIEGGVGEEEGDAKDVEEGYSDEERGYVSSAEDNDELQSDEQQEEEEGSDDSDIQIISPPASAQKQLQQPPAVMTTDNITHRPSFSPEQMPDVFQEVTASLNNTEPSYSQHPKGLFPPPLQEDLFSAQDEVEDDPFPPAHNIEQPVQLEDPWLGPKMYAEDFYAGGDFIEGGTNVSPDKLTALDDVASGVSTPFLGEITPISTRQPSPELVNRLSPEIIDVDVEEAEEPRKQPSSHLEDREECPGFSAQGSEYDEDEEVEQSPHSFFIAERGEDEDVEVSSEEDTDPNQYAPLGTSDLDVDVYSFEREQSVENDVSSTASEESIEEVQGPTDISMEEPTIPRSPPAYDTPAAAPPAHEPDTQPTPSPPPRDIPSPAELAHDKPSTLLVESLGEEFEDNKHPSSPPTNTIQDSAMISLEGTKSTRDQKDVSDGLPDRGTTPAVMHDVIFIEEEPQITIIEPSKAPQPLIVEDIVVEALSGILTDESVEIQSIGDSEHKEVHSVDGKPEESGQEGKLEEDKPEESELEESEPEEAKPEESISALKPQLSLGVESALESDHVRFDMGPITADPSMPDPFDTYFSTPSVPAVAKYTDFRGLFTPAESSTPGNTTPTTKPSPDMRPSLRLQTEPESSLHRTALVNSGNSATPATSPLVRSPLGLHTPVRRSVMPSQLVIDPYPANLSTPGYDHRSLLQDASDSSYDTSSTSVSSGTSEGDGSSTSPSVSPELEDASTILDFPPPTVEPKEMLETNESAQEVQIEPKSTTLIAESTTPASVSVEDESSQVTSNLEGPFEEEEVTSKSSPVATPSTLPELSTEISATAPGTSKGPDLVPQATEPITQERSTTSPDVPATPEKLAEPIEAPDSNIVFSQEVTAVEDEPSKSMSELKVAALDAVASKPDSKSPPADPSSEIDPFKLMGNDSTVAPGEVLTVDGASTESSSSESISNTPGTVTETKDIPCPVSVARAPPNSSVKAPPSPDTKPPVPALKGSSKRKRSVSPTPSGLQKASSDVTSKSQDVPQPPPQDLPKASVYTVAQAQAFPAMLFHAHGKNSAPLRQLPVIPKPPRTLFKPSSQTPVISDAVAPEPEPVKVAPVAETIKPAEDLPSTKTLPSAPETEHEQTEVSHKESISATEGTAPTTPSNISDVQETASSPAHDLPPIPASQKNEPPITKPRSKRHPPANHPSPVTRSNCRYHKISITRDEDDGPRIHFLVPGCSMGNRKLLMEENIIDLGIAQPEDTQRLVEDVETLDFVPALIAILRQLVGTEFLKEHEAFYLPMPEDAPVHRVQRPVQPKPSLQPAERKPLARPRPRTSKAKIKRASTSITQPPRSKPPSSSNPNKLSASLSVPLMRDRDSASTPPVSTSTSASAKGRPSVSTHNPNSESELSEIESSPPPAPPPKKQKQRLMSPALFEVEPGKDKPHPFEIGAMAISATASPASLKRARTAETSFTDTRTPKKLKFNGPLNGKH